MYLQFKFSVNILFPALSKSLLFLQQHAQMDCNHFPLQLEQMKHSLYPHICSVRGVQQVPECVVSEAPTVTVPLLVLLPGTQRQPPTQAVRTVAKQQEIRAALLTKRRTALEIDKERYNHAQLWVVLIMCPSQNLS